MLNKPQRWITGLMGFLLLLLGFITIVALFVFFFQLGRFTYCMGYTGLVLRLAVFAAIFIASLLTVMIYMRIRKKHNSKKGGFVVVAVMIICVFSYLSLNVVPTMRDLTSPPIMGIFRASVNQNGYSIFILTNNPIYSFPSSMMEVLRDEDGEVIFTPFLWNSFQNLTRRSKFSDDYLMTIAYYPNRKTRISTMIQKDI